LDVKSKFSKKEPF